MSRFRTGSAKPTRDSRARSPQAQQKPVDVLAHHMALARWAFQSGDWTAYEKARDTALHLVLAHRIEDEVGRFRRVTTACMGAQDRGEDARDLIDKRLTDAFQQGFERRESPHDLIVRMHRIPRAAATAALVKGMRRGDGENCVAFLLFKDDGAGAGEGVRASFGDDPAPIAARLTDRHWADFVTPLMAITPGELMSDMIIAARASLLRTLSTIAP